MSHNLLLSASEKYSLNDISAEKTVILYVPRRRYYTFGRVEFACQFKPARDRARRRGAARRRGGQTVPDAAIVDLVSAGDAHRAFLVRCRGCVTHSPKYARKSQARPFKFSRTHTRVACFVHSFIHRLDNIRSW